MHIPDGYLGPATSGALYAVMVPFWIAASRIVKTTLKARQAPLLAIGAAFSFVIMMFNVPIPAGSTGHAAGSVLVAILLGPWAALIAITVALMIQALLFGDGGITALGANSFNMAMVMPFVGYAVYRLVSGPASAPSTRRVLAAGIAGYVGITAAAFCAGVEFGLQPHLYPTVSGQALYCPYGLRIAVPAMAAEHLLVFGGIEALVTALVVRYLQTHAPELLRRTGPPMKRTTRLWLALGGLALLTPLGLVLPAYFKADGAWGEWSAGDLERRLGYIPQGVARLGDLWKAPLADYAFGPAESGHPAHASLAYLATALLGLLAVGLTAWALGRVLTREGQRERPRRRDFIARSIQGTLSFFKEALFAEETAGRPGILQALDPRIKIVTVLMALLLVLFTHRLAVLGLLYLLTLLTALLSRLELELFLKRTWVFIPLFSLLIAVPALFSFVSPGEPVCSLGPLHVTRPGLTAGAFFIGRVIASVSLVVLLSMTTRHFDLLKALRGFGIPQAFVMVLGMCYRYLYLFVEIVEHTHLAIRSRIGAYLHYRKGQKVVAWNMAHLWLRSYALNEQVYHAMVARGFRGEPVTRHRFRTRPRDWAWLFATAMALMALACLEWGVAP